MKSTYQVLLLVTCLFISLAGFSQAQLTIQNNSQRQMTVKVMKGNGEAGSLHRTVYIGARSNETISFSVSGYYFTKSKAELVNKEPIYQKGKAFKVINDNTGYSVLTLTFSITESATPEVTGGKRISKNEFDQN